MKKLKFIDIKNKKYLPVAVLIVLLGSYFVFVGFLHKVPAFRFNCLNGTLLGISGPIPPLACIGCLEHCDGHVLVKNKNGSIICESDGVTIGAVEPPQIVDVTCFGLENYENKEVLLKYEINSTYGLYENEMNLTVKWGKYERKD